jgi:two-component system response regulator PilR (NtrC family)
VEKILVVDDERGLREVMSIMLKRAGYAVTEASDGEEAIGHVGKEIFDLVITDLRMPKADGMAVLKAVKSTSPETVVLVITAFATADSAVDAMKQGAYDYLSAENILLKREMASQSSFAQLVGQSEGMQKVFDVVRKVADAKSNVLICGESGTGKELVARAIHYNSARSSMPFVAVNCSAVPETLLESELFGHMKGSFTGAMANKAGLFEVANGGTIFLDEIGDTTPTIQVKLLRVIQEREFRRVGGNQDVKVDVRIVAATNKDLEKAVADGSFREDLYYRLDVIPIRLPPLRLRTGDIPLLVKHFLEKFSQDGGKAVPVLTSEAMHVLLGHEWRGNVRELENLMERVVTFSAGTPVSDDDIRGWLHRVLSPQQQGVPADLPEDGLDLEGLINGIEKDLLLKALERTMWVKKKAARLLKLNTRSFRYRLEKYAIKGGRD